MDKEDGLFVKEAEAKSLCNEAAMTTFFHSLGLSAELLYYGTADGRDYLITRRLPGEDCTHGMYLESPERLCDVRAELLQALHETDFAGCPIPDRTESYRKTVEAGFNGSHYEPDLFEGIWTLKFNLGTARLTDRFIDAYGRDIIDEEKLRLIAAMESVGA